MLLWVFAHDFNAAATVLLHPGGEVWPAVAAVNPHQLPRMWLWLWLQKQLGSLALLHVGRMHQNAHQQAEGINQEVALTPIYILGFVVTVRPPFSVVLTLWLSRITALG